jgi:hypothetical protein
MNRIHLILSSTVFAVPAWLADAEPIRGTRDQPDGEVVGALALFVIVGIVLAIALFMAIYILTRTARQARALAAELPKPTEYQDIWAMHKPPDIDVLEEEEDDPWGLNRPSS